MSISLFIAFALFGAAAAHALVIGSWRSALRRSKGAAVPVPGAEPSVSVVIPARDEQEGIVPLLQDLHAQRYPKEKLEVIVVDDGSSDRTVERARAMQARWPQLRVLASAGSGKKAAITTGAEAAKGEWIVLTDADARCGPERIAAMAACWQASGAGMVIAPVRTDGHGVLGALQELEQAALLGAALGSALAGHPFLAYGANLGFSREGFRAVSGYAGDRYASGDDVFLLKRLRDAGRLVDALPDAAALVTVDAASSWGAFLRQRLRWAGKMRGTGAGAFLLGAAALLLPWLLMAATLRFDFIGGMGAHALHTVALLVASWLCWLLPIIALAGDAERLVNREARPLRALLALIAFSAYAPLVAAASLVVRPMWKGRRIR